jgi:hypothetical protein
VDQVDDLIPEVATLDVTVIAVVDEIVGHVFSVPIAAAHGTVTIIARCPM